MPNAVHSRRLVASVWLFVLIPALIMSRLLPAGWDARGYGTAVAEVHAGHSPYLMGMARLREKEAHPTSERTINYIYPPVTLPLLRWAGKLPRPVQTGTFWLLYAAGIFAVLRVQLGLLTARERPAFRFLAPFCIFFPGLLYDNAVLGGNIAPILYGIIALGFARSWRSRHWGWFQLCVLLASIFKPPMLTLLIIPPLMAQRQWLRSIAVGGLGCGLYAFQARLWPAPFALYGQLMNGELHLNHEFGFSPAGLLADLLLRAHRPWQAAFAACYAVCALLVAGVLLRCSRAFLSGHVSAQDWLPVLLLGTLLLNPRLMAYDAAAVTLPMALLAWRCLRAATGDTRRAALLSGTVFLLLNGLVALIHNWSIVEIALLITLFLASSRLLLQQAAEDTSASLQELASLPSLTAKDASS